MSALRALAVAALVALTACAPRGANLRDRLGCPRLDGVDRLLAQPGADRIVIDSVSADGADARAAAGAIACHAAARGERVMIGAPAEGAGVMDAAVRAFLGRGARLDLFRIAPAVLPPDLASRPPEDRERVAGEARAAVAARALNERDGAADRYIVIVAAPDGARGPVGLSGHTWRPLGARFPDGRAISLRAERTLRPGLRVRVAPFEDVPERGAALRYDGFFEVGPFTQQAPNAAPAGAKTR